MKSPRALSIVELSISENVKAFLGFLLLFASAQISIPLQPVPIVFTTVGVMLIGLLYSRKTALSSVLLYVVAGFCGLPVCQGFAGGYAHMLGPTGGYVIGFFLAVLVMSTLRERIKLTSFSRILLLCTIGTVTIFIPGVLWLSVLVGMPRAIDVGVLPFILPGLCKAVLLSGALRIIGVTFNQKSQPNA